MIQVVAGIIENERGEVLLAQRPPGKHLAGLWEFPGGKLELGESPEAALIRELQEELHLDVQPLHRIGTFPFTYDRGAIELHVIHAEARGVPRTTEEVQNFKWTPPTEIDSRELAPADIEPLKAFLSRPK